MFDSLSDRIKQDEGLKPTARMLRYVSIVGVSLGIFGALDLVLAFFE